MILDSWSSTDFVDVIFLTSLIYRLVISVSYLTLLANEVKVSSIEHNADETLTKDFSTSLSSYYRLDVQTKSFS